MLAGVGGHLGVFDVQVVGGGDVDSIDSRIRQHVLNRCVGNLCSVHLGKGVGSTLVTALHRHQLTSLSLFDTWSAPGIGIISGADDCPPDRHRSPLSLFMRGL